MSLDKPKSKKLDASDYSFAIAASRFNQKLVDALLKDVRKTLAECGAKDSNIRVLRVPGAAERLCGKQAGSSWVRCRHLPRRSHSWRDSAPFDYSPQHRGRIAAYSGGKWNSHNKWNSCDQRQSTGGG